MKQKTLEEILTYEREHRVEDGEYGIAACKRSIMFDLTLNKISLEEMLEHCFERANADVFYNNAMVLACQELIDSREPRFLTTENAGEYAGKLLYGTMFHYFPLEVFRSSGKWYVSDRKDTVMPVPEPSDKLNSIKFDIAIENRWE